MGWMDDDGYVYLSDRRTDLILAGGANIYPAEVEAALDEHPQVLSSVGRRPPRRRPRPARARDGADRTASSPTTSCAAHLAERLVRYKIPRSFEFVDEPLRDDAGKARRTAMRDAAIERLRNV